MPKLKTHSSAKKRFSLTSKGRVRHTQTGKRHCMIKRTPKQVRDLRGTKIMSVADEPRVKRHLLPNG
ncbi:MAG: 50S ribosomal protein L35 [Sneathiellaceae bacterium]